MESQQLLATLKEHYAADIVEAALSDMVTVELPADNLVNCCLKLRDDPALRFTSLMDLCGVDYLDYGVSEWRQEDQTASGYTRAVSADGGERVVPWHHTRYAVVYHLLSVEFNHRLRIKVYLEPEPIVHSVLDVWPAAAWYEREAFDLFGIVFEGHPDLRRILTDYGFKGHPFRKDFPLIGEVEMRYDAKREACVYEPVSIQPRVLVPKVIRHDNRYQKLQHDEVGPHD